MVSIPGFKKEKGNWLDYALVIEGLITSAAFATLGYTHCLMRREDLGEVERFFALLNAEMQNRVTGKPANFASEDYFPRLAGEVAAAARAVARYHFGKTISLSVKGVVKDLGIELRGESKLQKTKISAAAWPMEQGFRSQTTQGHGQKRSQRETVKM